MNRRRPLLVSVCWIFFFLPIVVPADQRPKNVIYMIGDGMGIAHITLARISKENRAPLQMDSMKYTGFIRTYSAGSLITDSAAAATAMATGYKTNNGMISMRPDGSEITTILEAAQKLEKAVGLVTTTTITHATPASFGSHVEARKGEVDIAPQYLSKKIDILLGGGRAFFLPKVVPGSKRVDERDLLQEAKAGGYAVVENREEMFLVKRGKLLGLFQNGALTTDSPEPTLAEMAEKALELLSKDKDGFFLMVEGGQIDTKAHQNNVDGTIKQTLDFDNAIGKVLSFARKNGKTLVIVTADHETGGLTLLIPETGSREKIKASWSTKGHSGSDVALFADGPGAHLFTGVMDNTEISRNVARLWRLSGFALN